MVRQILTMPCDINEESKQAGIRQNFTNQNFLMGNLPKLSFTKNSHYTVFTLLLYATTFKYGTIRENLTNETQAL